MKRKTSLRNQLFLGFSGLLLILVLVIGTFQHFVMEQYLTVSRIALMESRYHLFMEEEKAEESSDGGKLQGTAENGDSNENGEASEKSENSGLSKSEDHKKELQDVNYVLSRLVDRDVSAAYISTDGTMLGRAAYDTVNGQHQRNLTIHYGSDYLPILDKTEYFKRLQSANQGDYRAMTYKEKDRYGNVYLMLIRPISAGKEVVAFVQLSTPIENITAILTDQLRVYGTVSLIILGIGILILWIFLNFTLKPMKQMAKVVEQISVGNLDVRLEEEKGQEEITRLATSFNEMLERLELAFQQELETNERMRRFVSDASHELKTPLTSIHGFAEVLLRGAAKDEAQLEKALKSILSESERLQGLVNDLLALMRLDREKIAHREQTDLRALVEEIEPQLRLLAGERQLIFDFQMENGQTAYVNKDHLKQVFYNLVQNGIQHTDGKSGEIRVSVGKAPDGEAFIIEIKDNGAGIPEKDIPHIFDRFYRAETHRSRKQGGNGLGLSIVKNIIEGHDGKISVESTLGKGTSFKIELPKKEKSEV